MSNLEDSKIHLTNGGAFHRRIQIRSRGLETRAALEDDFHHFRVVIRHDKKCVVAARSESLRHPFDLCPAAGQRLEELIGMPLRARVDSLTREIDARQQCTHQFDLACLAIAATQRGDTATEYHAQVTMGSGGEKLGELELNGKAVMRWEVKDQMIVLPVAYAGQSITQGFAAYCSTLPDTEAEAALVLRRALFVSGARWLDPTEQPFSAGLTGGCWVLAPNRKNSAIRLNNNFRDFNSSPSLILQDDLHWLEFAGPS